MTGLLRLAGLNGVALLGFGVLTAVGAALVHRQVLAGVRSLPPAGRARALLAWAAAPAAVATALVGLTLWPSLGAVLGLAVDHCPAHDGHVHLCLHHLPSRGAGVVGAVALGVVLAAAGTSIPRGVRWARLAARLARAASRELSPGVGVVESPRPLALTVGWLRTRVLVSTALLRRVTPEQLAVVIAHERAHARRRDALTVALAGALSLLHLPFVRRELVRALTVACEQACDEAAATACGDRVLVAETIVAAERLAAAHPLAAPGLAFGGGDVADRVEALLGPRLPPAASRRSRWILLALLAALAAAAPHVHHWTETILDHLPH